MSRSSLSQFGRGTAAVAAGLGTAALIVQLFGGEVGNGRKPAGGPPLTQVAKQKEANSPTFHGAPLVKARPAPEFVGKGVDWLVKAQHPAGGWGAGSHASQNVRDPHAVQVDPATTAFVASALLREGSTPVEGKHKAAVRRATEYLCGIVEEYSSSGPKITDLSGTQIQAKLGPLVDTAMTAQYLARILPTLPKGDKLHARVDKALDKCLSKLNEAQQKDGSWNVGGGWANVLQSSLGCTALEYAQAAGKQVDGDRLAKAREYQLKNFDAKSGKTNTDAAAGVALYAFNSSMRANAAQSAVAERTIEKARKEGKLAADAPVTEENLKKAGVQPQAAQTLAAANANVVAQSEVLAGSKSYSGSTAVIAGTVVSGVLSKATADVPAEALVASMPALVAGPVPSLPVDGRSAKPLDTITTAPAAAFKGRTYAGGDTAVTTDEALLAGFGNNGGEEFLSYMLASESMVILGEKEWNNWYDKMGGRLSKVQNPDGSWSGHHCITSPVFCTAAVVQTMTADHDAEMLARVANEAAALAKVDVKK